MSTLKVIQANFANFALYESLITWKVARTKVLIDVFAKHTKSTKFCFWFRRNSFVHIFRSEHQRPWFPTCVNFSLILVRSSESYHLYFITKEGELYKSIFPHPGFIPEKEKEQKKKQSCLCVVNFQALATSLDAFLNYIPFFYTPIFGW